MTYPLAFTFPEHTSIILSGSTFVLATQVYRAEIERLEAMYNTSKEQRFVKPAQNQGEASV